GRAIAVSTDLSDVYVTGFTNSSDFPVTGGAFQPSFGGGMCSGGPCNGAFLVWIHNSGRLFYATYVGGSDSDVGLGIAFDRSGRTPGTAPRIHVRGGGFSTNFPNTPAS